MDVFVINMIPKSLSGETNQDSEPNLAVNLNNPKQIAATAFTPDPLQGPSAPIYTSNDGGKSWALNLIVPGAGFAVGFYLPTADITLRFGGKSNVLYAGILRADDLHLNVLRTDNYAGSAQMTVLEDRSNEDQPWVQAITAEKVGGAPDRVYIGNNNFGANPTATVDLSLDAATAPPPAGFSPNALTARIPAGGQNGPSIRTAAHEDGTVYAVFFNWQTPAAIPLTADVVICRDDNWAQGVTPFSALIDPGDNLAGLRFAPNVQIPWANFSYLGQERVGSHLSIAVDPHNSSVVYVAWADFPTGVAPYTIHLRRSTDRGVTWSSDLRLIPNGVNPALAISAKGQVGFLYQTLTDSGATWETHVEISANGFAGQWWTAVLAAVPSNAPARTFLPYLGDYVYLQAVGKDFYGIFSANNTPNASNFPNGVVYQRNANFGTHTLLDLDNVTPVPISIDPFFFKVTIKTGEVATAIADSGNFGDACLGSFVDEPLTINNPGDAPLQIFNITSSLADFEVPSVLSYPLKVSAGDSIDLSIRFRPTSVGPKSATLTIFSDDPAGPHTVSLSGACLAPRLSMLIANTGNFGKCCIGYFVDESLVLGNSSKCGLSVTAISSSSADFLVPQVITYPLRIGAGSALSVPIRFEPTSLGSKSATITVTSDDPAGPGVIPVSGDVPSGKLAVTGSTLFGGVKCCRREQRVVSVCNVGECVLHVSSVAFKRKRRHFRLINNPFPAILHPGSCLDVVIQYRAEERVPRACELVIASDDPDHPVMCLDVIAHTIWECCEGCRGEQGKKCCDEHCRECCKGSNRACRDDEDDDDDGEEREDDGES
ncbi:choice-of-anchor D domain-containing protein [Paraburkholderia unamae]|uniref:Choice-of-anchor D domain-containing protein n=1 Tax=Paraburkholderia unamae TaxID=219649 RepID=A0ACC6RWW5_9BURK